MRPRSRQAMVGLIALALLGCVPGPAKPGVTGTEPDYVLWGQIVLPPNPTPTPAPTTPNVAPTASPVGETNAPFAVQVTAESDYQELNVAPPPGKPERYRCTARVSAQVTMSNGDTHGDVTWESSDPAMATVDSLGNVRAIGQRAGFVAIMAHARDRKAAGSAWLRVTNLGDAEVIVD